MAEQVSRKEQDKTTNSCLPSLKYVLNVPNTVLGYRESEIKRRENDAPIGIDSLTGRKNCRQKFPGMQYVAEVHSPCVGSIEELRSLEITDEDS